MKCAIIGHGKMGREIERILEERGHSVALIIDEANAEAKKIVEEATQNAEKSCLELEESLNLEYKERVAQVKEDTLELIEQTIEKTNREADAMERKAMLNMPVAVRVISRRIVSECQ